tara:strand:- start:258 stop:446 length:189 start_codon:yes stop_codon:yes gene_type:complete
MAMIKKWTFKNCENLICKYNYEVAQECEFGDEYLEARQFVSLVESDLADGIISDLNAYDVKG